MNKKQIGKEIKKLREANKISRYRAGIDGKNSPDQVKSIEEASNNYTIESLLRHCEASGLELIVVNKPEK